MGSAETKAAIDERLLRWVSADPVLSAFEAGELRVGIRRFEPSGVDLVTAVVARIACFTGGPNQVAIAVPRGRSSLPLFLAAYFTVARSRNLFALDGSVVVATRDGGLRPLLERLHFTGGSGLLRGRLVTGRPDPGGRTTAKAGELIGSRRLKGLSQDDRFLLLQLPHYRPDLALNVVSVSIVDATSMSPSGWSLTHEWNRAAARHQVWLGELGDRKFEEFCAANEVPLWRFDWPSIEEASRLYGVGSTDLASSALCARAEEVREIGIRVCQDALADEEIVRLEQAFAAVYRRTKGEDVPGVVARARRLHYLLCRLLAPLTVYESIAAGTRAVDSRAVLSHVRDAPSGFFQGAKWKSVFEAEWPAIRAGLTALYEHTRLEHPKYYEALQRIELARREGERLVFRCATRAEARSLTAALVADGFVAADELGEGKFVHVSWFGTSSAPLPVGPARAPVVTLVSEPLAFAASTYLSAETGRLEASLYPAQVSRFERLVREATTAASSAASNSALVSLATGTTVPDDDAAPPPTLPLARLEPFTPTTRAAITEQAETKDMITMEGFFARLAALDDSEASFSRAGSTRGAEARAARLVRFTEGFCVFLAEDEEIPVLLVGESNTFERPVSELRPGQRVVLIPGSDRASMLADLFEAFDQRLGPAFPLLYGRAFVAAWEKAGGSDRALAEKVGVDAATVATWRRGEHRPQQDEHLNAVLKLSGIEPAWENRRRIREYLATVRGAHRAIARAFDDAVTETIIEPDGRHLKQLEELGLEADELFGSVQVLTVESVSIDNVTAPGTLIGHFLAPDHPAVEAASG